jgi:ABC-type uncharacterized transport system permease subunit
MTSIRTEKQTKSILRLRIISGILLIAVALFMFLVFGLGSAGSRVATFGLNPSYNSQALHIPDLVLPVQASIYFLCLVAVFMGAWQLARGFRSSSLVVGVVAFIFIISFLIWATRDNSFSLLGMLSSSLVRATPIALAALCGVISEKSGVVNIAIEGILLLSAQAAVVSATLAHNLYVGLVVAILVGAAAAGVHAVLAIRFKVNQIVSGVAINIFAVGATSFISSRFLEKNIDLLNNIYIMIFLVLLLHFILFYTPWGLRTRAVGEHPKAADTLGINVFLMRYVNVMLGGAIAGVGGAYFTIGAVGRFDQVMTAGKGFIGLAAMIFGKWNPLGAFASSLIFGFADSLQVKMQILKVPIPSEFLLMAPYIVTMIVLAGVVGSAVPPAADGEVYEKQ